MADWVYGVAVLAVLFVVSGAVQVLGLGVLCWLYDLWERHKMAKTNNPQLEACAVCRWFAPSRLLEQRLLGDDLYAPSQCRKNAPGRYPEGESWPRVEPSDWCGEFAHKPAAR